ncbi:MAG: transcriptional repressor [Clostridia bacterium]|nr:transcriptional repressor [Clostridia bacterium]MBQ2948082.1 transcriptional repressor [Clostridia bacterium]MBQ4608873.1 transcriptional repressor [Clostridia bacterium]MBQ6859881.1 transcriptional repressor [Clostridia bacterium]MBQ7052738.1 transcriptional repressor [Clostridia bacterium]
MSTRISAQAKAVLAVLADRRCHLTAEEVLESMDSIGTATVYRALDHLTELGLIRRLALGKKSAVYEYIRDSHMHFVCNRCGKVYDIQADFSGMAREAAKVCGYHVNWTEVTSHGICRACESEINQADEASAPEK